MLLLLAFQLQAAAPTFTVPRVEANITIDGTLTDTAWQSAARLSDFHQYEPVDGRSAEECTEVLVFYSARAIHFGIIASAKNPSTIRATLADRDNIESDDRVTIYLDTFDDRRRAFMFGVNPLGVQEDGVRTEGAVSAGKVSMRAGKSHSCERPTMRSRKPSAATISVALGISVTTRSAAMEIARWCRR